MPKWVWINKAFDKMSDDEAKRQIKIRSHIINDLADKINYITDRIQRRHMGSMSEEQPEFDTEDECYELRQQIDNELDEGQLLNLHSAMKELGAKMVRLY